VSPILSAKGGLSSQAYGQFAASTGVVDTGAMFPIAMVQVGSAGAANIEFTSIPSTYKHLEIRYIARANVADTNSALLIRFNTDTGSNYSWHTIRGDGASGFYVDGLGNSSGPFVASIVGDTSTGNIYGAGTISIPDYANTGKYKTARSFGGFDVNGSGGYLQLSSESWRSTTAINSIKFTFSTGSGFLQYSHFALYGIK
jgi:hypothetical protein